MFKFVAVVFAALMAVVFAAPNPAPKPSAALLTYNTPLSYPLAYSSQYQYSAPAYSAPSYISSYGTPLAYSAYAPAYYL
ncbi:neuropeptide-like 4 isoform X2 [Euwallacea similis]|uniref:neuropeptide-like 4 isoform X1 n=1 Tax=Euwallacea similis TaxID=1736056 RepID=UPI00344BE6A5